MNYSETMKQGMARDITAAIMDIKPVAVQYQCENCDDTGFALDPETHRPTGKRCECAKERRAARLRRWKVEQLDRLNTLISGRVDLSNTDPRPYMQRPQNQSLWLYGVARRGKTHYAAWLIKQAIESAENDFVWGWYPIREIIKAWKDQYSDIIDLKMSALKTVWDVQKCEILVIDDIDKIGTITAAREEEFYGLIDDMHGRRVQLIVTSQHSIDAFCSRMTREALFMAEGRGPISGRLHEIMPKDQEVRI